MFSNKVNLLLLTFTSIKYKDLMLACCRDFGNVVSMNQTTKPTTAFKTPSKHSHEAYYSKFHNTAADSRFFFGNNVGKKQNSALYINWTQYFVFPVSNFSFRKRNCKFCTKFSASQATRTRSSYSAHCAAGGETRKYANALPATTSRAQHSNEIPLPVN